MAAAGKATAHSAGSRGATWRYHSTKAASAHCITMAWAGVIALGTPGGYWAGAWDLNRKNRKSSHYTAWSRRLGRY